MLVDKNNKESFIFFLTDNVRRDKNIIPISILKKRKRKKKLEFNIIVKVFTAFLCITRGIVSFDGRIRHENGKTVRMKDSCAEAQEAQGVGDAIASETRAESAYRNTR